MQLLYMSCPFKSSRTSSSVGGGRKTDRVCTRYRTRVLLKRPWHFTLQRHIVKQHLANEQIRISALKYSVSAAVQLDSVAFGSW